MPSSPVERRGSRPAEEEGEGQSCGEMERARFVKGKGNPVLSRGGRGLDLRRGREVRRLERGGCQNQKEKERAPRTEYWKRTGVSVTLAVPSLPEVVEAEEVEEVEDTGEVEVTLTKLLVRR